MNTFISIECPKHLTHIAVILLDRIINFNGCEDKSFNSVIQGRKWFYGHEEKLGYFVEYLGEE